MKCIHIMISNGSYNLKLIKLLSEIDCGGENYFITNNKEFSIRTNGVARYNHEVLSIRVLKQLFYEYDYVFFHSMPLSTFSIFALGKNRLKKAVWVIWGHDLYITPSAHKCAVIRNVLNLLKKIRRRLRFVWLKDLAGIGIGFKYDAIEIRRLAAKINIYNMPYFSGSISDVESTMDSNSHDKIRIMVGHSAYSALNHKGIIDRLTAYKNENIIFSFPLSYGQMEYAKEVKKYAISKLGVEKVEILENSLDYSDYVNYIRSVDIAIIDSVRQTALGNIYLLANYGKKIYLNSNGILYQSGIFEGWFPGNVEDIGALSFKNFIETPDIQQQKIEKCFGNYYLDYSIAKNNWLHSLLQLKKKLPLENDFNDAS